MMSCATTVAEEVVALTERFEQAYDRAEENLLDAVKAAHRAEEEKLAGTDKERLVADNKALYRKHGHFLDDLYRYVEDEYKGCGHCATDLCNKYKNLTSKTEEALENQRARTRELEEQLQNQLARTRELEVQLQNRAGEG